MHMFGMNQQEVSSAASRALDTLGPKLTAEACAARKWTDVKRWADGAAYPDEDQLERLLVVNEVLATVVGSDGPKVARAWFMGMSCGEERTMSPADAIRVGNYDDARGSARSLADNA